MKNDVEAFVSWLKKFEAGLPGNIVSKITVGPASPNKSAYIDLEMVDGEMGRLLFHEYGGANADVIDCNGEQLDLSSAIEQLSGWEQISPERFDEAFKPFTNHFLLNKSTN